MKAAWEELGTEYESSSSVLIGDADCTVETELCGDHGVKGYPTIKYYPAGEGKEGKSYSGGRDKDSLKKFVQDTLEVKCDTNSKEGCSDKEIKFIDSVGHLATSPGHPTPSHQEFSMVTVGNICLTRPDAPHAHCR